MDKALQICLVVDRRRCSAARLVKIATGWSQALRNHHPESRRIGVTLVSLDEAASGVPLFPSRIIARDRCADQLQSKGRVLAFGSGNLIESAHESVGIPQMLERVFGAVSAVGRAGVDRALVVYSEELNRPRSDAFRDVLDCLRAFDVKECLLIFAGYEVERMRSGAAIGWSLAKGDLAGASSVERHADAIIGGFFNGTWEEFATGAPAAVAERTPVELGCDNCGSTPSGCVYGDGCIVCGLGRIDWTGPPAEPDARRADGDATVSTRVAPGVEPGKGSGSSRGSVAASVTEDGPEKRPAEPTPRKISRPDASEAVRSRLDAAAILAMGVPLLGVRRIHRLAREFLRIVEVLKAADSGEAGSRLRSIKTRVLWALVAGIALQGGALVALLFLIDG